MDAWCQLKSLYIYIKAEHSEPQMSNPYMIEIWRAIDQFELVIEQQNNSFHVKAVVMKDSGTITYLDKRDTFRTLNEEQLADWRCKHNHNINVLLHDMACSPEKYSIEIDDQDRIAFYQDSIFLTSFGLDDQSRPHLFYQPTPDGTITGTLFNRWGTHGGLAHSAGCHPIDSNFMYQTEIWTPSTKSLVETFGKGIFDLE